MAAAKLDAPIADMIVVNGIVSDASNPGNKTSYAELIGGKYIVTSGQSDPSPLRDKAGTLLSHHNR